MGILPPLVIIAQLPKEAFRGEKIEDVSASASFLHAVEEAIVQRRLFRKDNGGPVRKRKN